MSYYKDPPHHDPHDDIVSVHAEDGGFAQSYILERERSRLATLLEHGVHPVYGPSDEVSSWTDGWATDWTMDFSWHAACIREWQYMLDDAECMKLMSAIKDKYIFDLVQYIKECQEFTRAEAADEF